MNLVTLTNPQSPAAEAYRTLRANIYFAALEKPIRTLVVTSPSAAENRSVAAANLAVVMAQSERKVILVDADLRKPTLHSLFGLDNGAGLSDVLSNPHAGALSVRPTAIPGLSVLTAGATPASPSDVLSANRARSVIDLVMPLADCVVFDAPPLLAASDAAMLASLVDATLLVLAAGATRREQAQSARDILGRARARLLGVVMLNARRDRSSAPY